MLIITNGDCAAERIKEAGFADEIVSWNDVLHDGPVPYCTSLEEQSKGRAAFIAKFADLAPEEVLADFKRRDAALLNAIGDIQLWFEHDLYDQLQLLQVLFVLKPMPSRPKVWLVQSDDYLSEMEEAAFLALPDQAKQVTEDQYVFAGEIWRAFTNKDHEKLRSFGTEEIGALPYVLPAIRRLLDEYPSDQNGLPKSLELALHPLSSGPAKIKDLFIQMQKQEVAKFMGDLSFARLFDTLIDGTVPLVKCLNGDAKSSNQTDYMAFFEQEVMLTEVGQRVLQGKASFVELNGINRWIGGRHLRE